LNFNPGLHHRLPLVHPDRQNHPLTAVKTTPFCGVSQGRQTIRAQNLPILVPKPLASCQFRQPFGQTTPFKSQPMESAHVMSGSQQLEVAPDKVSFSLSSTTTPVFDQQQPNLPTESFR